MKTIKILAAVLSLSVMYQFAAAQGGGCPNNKVLMSVGATGCGCWGCTKICVLPSEVATYQSNGWRLGKCPSAHCCNFVRLDEETSSTETSLTEIYPNPSSGTITIFFNLSQQGEVSLEVFDMMGRFVTSIAHDIFEEESNEVIWDASVLNQGIYFVKMKAGEYTTFKKISVVK